MLERERAFSAEASHQMRTPLTAVRLSLESAMLTPGGDLRDAVRDALTSLDRLEQTVIDLIELARDTSSRGEVTDVSEVVQTVVRPWRRPLSERGRPVVVQIQPDLPGRASPRRPCAPRSTSCSETPSATVRGGSWWTSGR